MNRWKQVTARFAASAVQAGFTMIELLVVIAILGILATAVLSAINPIEQINRGRDTGSRSDAEQLLSAIDRYNAFNGHYPWVSSQAAADAQIQIVETAGVPERVDHTWSPWLADASARIPGGTATTLSGSQCSILARLSTGSVTTSADCVGTEELKTSYVNRITRNNYRGLFAYKAPITATVTSSSPYVCFVPQSAAFRNEAAARCNVAASGPLPADFPAGACAADGAAGDWVNYTSAAGTNVPANSDWICLP